MKHASVYAEPEVLLRLVTFITIMGKDRHGSSFCELVVVLNKATNEIVIRSCGW